MAQLYVSPNDDGVPGSICIPINAGNTSLPLWIDGGAVETVPAGAKCDGTGGTTAGDEVCMYDFNIGAQPGISIVSFMPDGGAGIVHNTQADRARFNGGNPLTGTVGPTRVGELVVAATAPASLTIDGEAVVDTMLAANAVSGTLASAQLDGDLDTLCDIEDPCIAFANTMPLPTPGGPGDENSDGIPSECQCGDSTGDGLLGFDDATCLAQCFVGGGVAPGCDCVQTPLGIGDTNHDDLWGFDDATNVAQAFVGGLPTHALTCNARPEGTPAP